jgi:sigma-E factor negative regulatory protein RseB
MHRSGALLLALALPGPALAQQPPAPATGASAQEWMAKMAGESRRFEYQGIMVYAHDGRIDTMRVSRSLGPAGMRDEMVSLNGDRRVLVREDGRLTCSDRDGSKVEVAVGEFPLLAFDPLQFGGATGQYRLTVSGRDRVAGMDSAVVEARPVDQSRYGYRLWVEPSSGMLLGSNLENPDGHTVQQLMFTTIALTPGNAPKLVHPKPAPAPESAVASGWRAGWLPAGFKLVGTPAHASGQAHLLYSDGLAYVSVYIEPLRDNARPMQGTVKRGAVNLYAQPMRDRQVVVIGDVPPMTVERIARAVEPAPAGH